MRRIDWQGRQIADLIALFAGIAAGFLDLVLDQPEDPVRQAAAIVFRQFLGLLLEVRFDANVDNFFFGHALALGLAKKTQEIQYLLSYFT